MLYKLIHIFVNANHEFIDRDISLILANVNERGLCGALAQHLVKQICHTEFKDYYVDVEYNRNDGRIKTIIGQNLEVIKINCDLILHSRGEIACKDNLIALEMKKSTSRLVDKVNDKNRLIALTKDSYDDVWSFDGKTLPKHVCGYELGIYYEVNKRFRIVSLEYYSKGKLIQVKEISI